MAKRPDPFAGAKLTEQVGLDQRLFREQPPSKPEPPKERTDGLPAESSSRPPAGRTPEPPVARIEERLEGGSSGLSKEGSTRRRGVTAAGPSRRSKGQPAVQVTRIERLVDRRPYDFFQDQIRWLNRKKVELEEDYGIRVPANAMVQLAVDLLIADYEANRRDSQLIKVLIEAERPSVHPYGRPVGRAKEGSDG